jgi:microcystin-dependent protein
MGKTVFSDTPPQGTIVTAAFLNALNAQRHDGLDDDGHGVLDYAVTSGSANAYVLTLNPALAAHVAGMPIRFKANFTNTAAATININNLGAVALKKNYNQALAASDILSGQIITICFDGTNYQVTGGIRVYDPLSVLPPGAELLWPGETPPSGWFEENGAAVSRTTYAALYAVIGTMYGDGDGSTTFNLPDPRGQFIRIWDHSAGVDPDAATRTDRGDGTDGDHVGTNQADVFKKHAHALAVSASGQGSDEISTKYAPAEATTYATAGIGGNETRPKNTNRMMIIKY